MITQIYDTVCYGCSACQAVCPKNAISMVENEKGFLEPSISSACISCGKCVQVCRAANSFHQVKKTYIAKRKDPQAQMASQSGGAFAVIAEAVLQKGGVVYGAALDETLEAHHIRVTGLAELEKLKGSKYIPSRMEHTHAMIAEDLCAGHLVLFSGTPCQVAAVYRFLAARHIPTENLYTVDLICHGTPSVLLWRDLLTYYEKKNDAKVKAVVFRDKTAGIWGSHTTTFRLENGNIFSSEDHKNLFYNNLALGESCYTCVFAQENRIGDISIGDAWGVEKENPEFYDKKGVSLVLFNTEKASQFIPALMQEMEAQEVQLSAYLQGPLREPSRPHREKKEFWRDYHTKPFSYMIRKYAKNNIFLNWKYIFRKIRGKLHGAR